MFRYQTYTIDTPYIIYIHIYLVTHVYTCIYMYISDTHSSVSGGGLIGCWPGGEPDKANCTCIQYYDMIPLYVE